MDGLLGSRLNRNIWLGICLLLFGFHQWAQLNEKSSPWVDSYVDPILFLPIALGASSWVIRRIQPLFIWDWRFVFGAWMAASLVFEWWIPSFDNRFTADYWDILCYGLGGIIVCLTERIKVG